MLIIYRYSNQDLVNLYQKLPFLTGQDLGVDATYVDSSLDILIALGGIIFLTILSLGIVYPPLPVIGPGQGPKGYPQPGTRDGGGIPFPDCDGALEVRW